MHLNKGPVPVYVTVVRGRQQTAACFFLRLSSGYSCSICSYTYARTTLHTHTTLTPHVYKQIYNYTHRYKDRVLLEITRNLQSSTREGQAYGNHLDRHCSNLGASPGETPECRCWASNSGGWPAQPQRTPLGYEPVLVINLPKRTVMTT